jgi:hypothetical protein
VSRDDMPVVLWAGRTTTEPTSYAADRLLAGHLAPGQVAMSLGVPGDLPEGRPEVVLVGTPDELRRLAFGIDGFVDDLVAGDED